MASKPGFFLMLCSAYFTVLLIHPNNYSFLCMEHPYDLCFFSVLKTNLCFLRLLGGTLTLILLCLYALKWWCFLWFRISRAWLRILRSAWPSLLAGFFLLPQLWVILRSFAKSPALVCFLFSPRPPTHAHNYFFFYFLFFFWPYYLPVIWGFSVIKNSHPFVASSYFVALSFSLLRTKISLC